MSSKLNVDRYISADLTSVARAAQVAEDAGYDGIWMPESNHDVFLQSLLAADVTERIAVGTNVAVAFSRNPMSTAYAAWDLNAHARGRFVLGLGSQVKPHIERRFSMPWSHPARRMREFIEALRAIWSAWQEGTRLDFSGEFYTHTLMSPLFDPGGTEYGAPKVFVAAVGEAMTRVAGEVGDGMLAHPFTTERYLCEVTLPSIEEGLRLSGRRREDFELHCPVLVVSGRTSKEREAPAAAAREQIAFYGSTPAYRPVLELHGWADLCDELNALSKQRKWAEMPDLINDEVLHTFAVVGKTEDDVSAHVHQRLDGIADRISVYPQYDGAEFDRSESALLTLKDRHVAHR